MKNTLFIISLFCTIISFNSHAEEKKPKETKVSVHVKAAKTALKNVSGQDNAEKNIIAATARPELTDKDRADLFLLAAQLEESKNMAENTKAYLKQKYDTASFFSTLLNMYSHLRTCDSLDAVPAANGDVKLKFASKTGAMRQKYNKNILNGGKFFMTKGNYDAAYLYFDNYHTYASAYLPDSTVKKVASWAALCGYNGNKPQRTLKYIDEAIDYAQSHNKPILQEYKVRSYLELNDDEQVLAALHDGVRRFPGHDYFFVNLADRFYAAHNIESGLLLADSLIGIDSGKALYWYTKSKFELANNDYDKCIEFSDSTILRDSTFIDAYYNKGISYLNLALIVQENACTDIRDPRCMADRNKILDLYRHAKPCMEKVREATPDDIERWGNPLYRIYMNLNMGKEFEEVDKALKQKK